MNKNPLAITNKVVELLRTQSAKAEAEGKLTAEQLDVIYRNKWFKLFVPKYLGGLELTVPEGVRLEEELAWIDGSLGWTITLCSGANLFVGYIDQSRVSSIFSDPKVCLGGSGYASGRAIAGNEGYMVTGKWNYATGAPHNTFFTANCVVERTGKTVLDGSGQPLVKSFFFASEDVQVIEDWKAFGLKATASHSFSVTNLWVDNAQAFLIGPQYATLAHPTYRYPFLQFAEVTLAVNTLGMVRHFVECAEAIIGRNQQADNMADPFELIATAKRQIEAAKRSFYEVLDRSWNELLHMDAVSPDVLEAVSEKSRMLVKISREQVVALYPYVGLAAADESSTINRIWRDIFTASQHSLLRL